MSDGPGPRPRHNLWPFQAWGTGPFRATRGKGKGWFTLWSRLEGSRLRRVCSPLPGSPQKSQQAKHKKYQILAGLGPVRRPWLAPVTERSYPHERPVPPGGGLRPPSLSPQPSASTSISCDNLQTEDQLAPPTPPHPGFWWTPRPTPPPAGPQLQEAPAECNSPRPPLRPGPVRTD